MKYVTILSLATYGVLGYQDVRKNFNGERVVDIHLDHLSEDVRSLLQQHEGDLLGSQELFHSVKVTPDVLEKLEATGVSFEDTTEKWINDLQANFDNPHLFCNEEAADCAARNTQDFFASYQSLAALTSRIEGLVAASSLATMEVIGTSTEGRDLNIVEIANDDSKPLAYFICNIHAREWLTPMYCAYMIENLLADGGHPLLDTFSFAIIPCANPDGYEYSRLTYSLWRKTRNINAGSSCIGTDPNRNYNNNHCGPGTSNNPCSEIFCGTEPFSTPEVATVNAYGQANADRLITFDDFHSYGGYWLSPLGYARGTPPAVDYNRMLTCMTDAINAVRSTTGQRFQAGGAADLLGVAAGASDDYHYFEYGVIYSFTVEMRGNSFQPATSNIAPAMLETFAGMVAQMECIEDIEINGNAVDTPATETPCTDFFC